MTELQRVLMKRDNMTLGEVNVLIDNALDHIDEYKDPDEFMSDWFGLEPDYLPDVLCRMYNLSV